MVLDIRFQASAAKALRKLDPVWQQRIRVKLYEYAAEPAALSQMVKRLTGDGRLRLRVGDYRVIFTEDGVVLVVQAVGHRSDIYRRLT